MDLSKQHILLLLFNEYIKGTTPIDATIKISQIYGAETVTKAQIEMWYRKFQMGGGFELQNELASSSVTTEKIFRQIHPYYRNRLRLSKAEEAALPSDDDKEDDDLDDDDICSSFELEQSFQQKYKISDESTVSLKKDYVLSLCQDHAFTRLAAGLSNGAVQIFDITSERSLSHSSIECIPPPVKTKPQKGGIHICGVQFLDETSSDCLLIGTTNGLVRLFDLRTQNVEASFKETERIGDEPTGAMNITNFDRNANSRVLCTGTEQYQNNVYLIFYDIRERKQLGAYVESHHDDVTSLRFHTRNPDILCSGSTDGLINIYDIKETNEDDALLTTINTESSVYKLNWHKNVYEKNVISCITHTNDFKAYECEGDLVAEFQRDNITESMKRKNPSNCNLVNAHNMEDGGVFLLAGTNIKKGEILRSLQLQNKQLLPFADFDGNKQIVRESTFNAKNQVIITAGESGIVTLWTPQGTEQASSSQLKSKTKLKSSKKTPY